MRLQLTALFLRLFYSLLALPIVAAACLLVLHRLASPTTYFSDLPVILLLWVLIFIGLHFLLHAIGQQRFAVLDRLGWSALQSNETNLFAEIFAQMEALLAGGLFARGRREALQRKLLRRYFAFYRDNVEERKYRFQLVQCLRLDIRAAEAFAALKDYLLRQPELTIEFADLAEVLLEHAPDDAGLIHFMVERYLRDKQSHFRAEYFYVKVLAKKSEHVDRILHLYGDSPLKQTRTDDFAAWFCVRAFEQGLENGGELLGRRIFTLHRLYKAGHRDDDLANKIAGIFSSLRPEDVKRWEAELAERKRKSLLQYMDRLLYLAQQRLLEWWTILLRQRRHVYYAAGGLLALGLLYLLLPAGNNTTRKQDAAETLQIAPGQKLFSLQVAATKSARAARREVARLKKAGLDAYLIEPTRKNGWYRIRLGRFPSKQAAQEKGQSLRRQKVIREYFLVNFEGK